MKKLLFLCLSIGLLMGCSSLNSSSSEEIDYTIGMDNSYPVNDCLEDGNSQKARVILLLGQSNATGCSLIDYLEKGVSEEEFKKYQDGFSNVLINYCLDNKTSTTDGKFKKVDLDCGIKEGYFGPELGMAEKLSSHYKDEKVYILKFTMSGFSLNHHWLTNGERGEIYASCLEFTNTYLEYLDSKNYDVSVDAICWMQGESDTTEEKASRYYDNQKAFVSYLREDLSKYQNDKGIYFIDAGISSSPYCLPSYPEINEAKVKFSKDSHLNIYFPTIENGLTTLYEPVEDPDLGHYDALSELKLGHLFGEAIINNLNK